jgi:outer membrane protein
MRISRTAAILACLGAATAQTPLQKLTLQQAEAIAVKNHPQVQTALLNALAANQVTIETRSALYPTLLANVTGAVALNDSRIAAGALNNPIIYNRLAGGLTVGQLVTDFGRTRNLTASANLRSQAEQQNAQTVRAQILLQVSRAYFGALRTQAVLVVAHQTVDERQLVVDQVFALAQSKLKSDLDLSFARVNLAEAKLLLASAENEHDASMAELSEALGYSEHRDFQVSEEALPGALATDPAPLVEQAMQARPEVASLRAQEQAAARFAKAEQDLSRPTVSVLASAGGIPWREDPLTSRWGAVGVNVSIPIFNGFLFSARRQEAELHTQAASQQLRDMEVRIARDVQISWLNANTAFQRLGLTQELLEQANLALNLSQARYSLGLSSIVELSQAQLNQTSAQITATNSRYDYQLQRYVLDYQVGALR